MTRQSPGPSPDDHGEGPGSSGCHRVFAGGRVEYVSKLPARSLSPRRAARGDRPQPPGAVSGQDDTPQTPAGPRPHPRAGAHADAWDEATGVALVVDPKRGTRHPVTDHPEFPTWSEPTRWRVPSLEEAGAHWKDEGPDDGPWTEQVPAWLITSKGRATPTTVDAHGHVDDAESADRLIPPGEEFTRQARPVDQPLINPGERPW